MDVTSISKQGTVVSTRRADVTSERVEESRAVNDEKKKPSESDVTIVEDPIQRAEKAIGGFFADSRFPTGRFSIDHDDESGRYVYRLVDWETSEVLKQFPNEYVLQRVAYYRELQGVAVNSEV